MHTLSPVRGLSPVSRPKINFTYQPSPLKERNSHTPGKGTAPLSPGVKQIIKFCQQKTENDAFKCVKCGKEATYKGTTSTYYCSGCAVQEMALGNQVVNLRLQQPVTYHQKNQQARPSNLQRSPSPINEPVIDKAKRETELEGLLGRVAEEKEELESVYRRLNSKELTDQGIKVIYRNRKVALKKHYEKIKATIKSSIEKDLEQLERREQESLKCIEHKRNETKENLTTLDYLRADIEPYRQNILTTIVESDYRMLISRHQHDNERIVKEKAVSLQLLRELSAPEDSPYGSESWHSRTSHQDEPQSLYNPFHYTMFDSKQKGRRGETLFSFEGKMP